MTRPSSDAGKSGGGDDLRTLLVDAALEILADAETPLELRKVAEAAGKSRTAPYLVFGKESEGGGLAALRMAVAAEGAWMLAERMEEARSSTDDPRLGFHRVTRALFTFATENERLFRLMVGPELGTIPLSGDEEATRHPEFDNLVAARMDAERVVARVMTMARDERIVADGDPLRLTMGAWSVMIGIAFLLLDRVLEAAGVRTTVEQGAELATSILMGSGAESLTNAALALLAAREDKEPPGASIRGLHRSGVEPTSGRASRPALPPTASPTWSVSEPLPSTGGVEDRSRDEGPAAEEDATEDVDPTRMRMRSTWSRATRWRRDEGDTGGPPPATAASSPSQEADRTTLESYRKATDTISEHGALRRAAMAAPALRGASILWIDDHPKGLLWERRTLEELGVVVAPAWSTRVALERIAEHRFDLIISDIARGDRDDEGVAALPRIRAAAPDVPVLFYIGRLDPTRGVPDGAAGITDRIDELLHLILDVLERRRL